MYVCYCRANVISQEYESAVTLVRFMYGYNIMHTAGMELRCLLTRYDSYLPSLTHLGYWALRHRAMAPINYRLDATDLVPKLYQTGTTRVTRDREKTHGTAHNTAAINPRTTTITTLILLSLTSTPKQASS
jgi:hypothetical protein